MDFNLIEPVKFYHSVPTVRKMNQFLELLMIRDSAWKKPVREGIN